jgi:uncharacterized protein
MVEKEPKPTTSEWIEVRKSGVHGKGVYAAKDIQKGTKIIEYVGKKVSKEEGDEVSDRDSEAHGEDEKNGAVYLFELDMKHDLDGNVPWNTARLINHSCEPNCETEGTAKHIWIVALKDIKKGEELGYDYCYDMDDFENHSCKCGAKGCVGYIVAEKHRVTLRKKLRWRRKREKREKNRNS